MQYRYVALTREGAEQQGTDEATSPEELARRLRQRRLVLVKAKPVARSKVPLALNARLVGELAGLLDSGVALERALQILAEEAGTDRRLAELARRLRDGLKRGQSFSEALASAGEFDPLLVPLVRAGEASGHLPGTLAMLEGHYEAQRQLRSDLLAALAYPLILLVVSILSLLGLGLYVIPVFKDLFADEPGRLPGATHAIFWTSDALLAYGHWLLLATLVLIGAARLALRASPALRRRWHRLALGLPLAGPLLSLAEGGRLMTLLGVLLERGVPLVRAMELGRDGVRNLEQRAGLAQAIQALRQGRPLPAAMQAVPALPERARQLLKVGDESGRLAGTCVKAGERLQRDLRTRIKALVSLAEPAIILFMGGVIGFVVVSMLLAVFSLSDLSGG